MSQLRRPNDLSYGPSGSYQLDSLLLLVTLCGVWFAVARLALSLAMVALALILPALLRTVVITRGRNAAAQPVLAVRKISLFVESLGAVTLIMLAGGSLFLIISYMGAFFAHYVHQVYASDGCAILVLLLALATGGVSAVWAGYSVAQKVCPDRRLSRER